MKKTAFLFVMFLGAAAFAQDLPDTAAVQNVPDTVVNQAPPDTAVIAEEAIADTAVVQELPDTAAVVQELPDVLPDVAAEQEPLAEPQAAAPDAGSAVSDAAPTTPKPTAKPDKPQQRQGIRFSAGAGGFFANSFNGGIAWSNGARVSMPYSGGGGYLFFDAVYAEVSAGYSIGGGRWESASASDKDNLPDMKRDYVHGGLFAKYPFTFGSIKVFPLVGAEYEYALSGSLKYKNLGGEYKFDGKEGCPNKKALNAPWGKIGGGADFALGHTLYLRSEFLYGVRAANWFEKDYAKKQTYSGAKGNYGHGLTVKIGAGVNLYP